MPLPPVAAGGPPVVRRGSAGGPPILAIRAYDLDFEADSMTSWCVTVLMHNETMGCSLSKCWPAARLLAWIDDFNGVFIWKEMARNRCWKDNIQLTTNCESMCRGRHWNTLCVSLLLWWQGWLWKSKTNGGLIRKLNRIIKHSDFHFVAQRDDQLEFSSPAFPSNGGHERLWDY